MRRALPILACVFALSACDRSPSVEVTNATPEQVAEEVRKSGAAEEMQRPGKWVISTSLVDLKSPDMPPEQIGMMRNMMSSQKPVERCVTADDLKQANALMGQNPAGCTFDHYRLAGGKIDGEAHCKAGAMEQRMTIKGTYTGDTTTSTVTSEVKGGGRDMTMTLSIKAQRTGPC